MAFQHRMTRNRNLLSMCPPMLEVPRGSWTLARLRTVEDRNSDARRVGITVARRAIGSFCTYTFQTHLL